MGATSTKPVQPLYLNDDIFLQVAHFMDSRSLLVASQTCRHFRALFKAMLGRPDSVFRVSLCGNALQDHYTQLRSGKEAASFARDVRATALSILTLDMWSITHEIPFSAVTDLTLVQPYMCHTSVHFLHVFPNATRVCIRSATNTLGTTAGLSVDMLYQLPASLVHFDGEVCSTDYCPTFDFSIFPQLRELRVKLTLSREFDHHDLHEMTLKVPPMLEVLHVTFSGISTMRVDTPGPEGVFFDVMQVGHGDDSDGVHKIVGLAACTRLRDVRVVGYGQLEFGVLRGVRKVVFGCRQSRGRLEQCDTVTIEHYSDSIEDPERPYHFENEGVLTLAGVREFHCALEGHSWTVEPSEQASLETLMVPYTDDNFAEITELMASVRRLTLFYKDEAGFDRPAVATLVSPQLEFLKIRNVSTASFRVVGEEERRTEIWCVGVARVLVNGDVVEHGRFILETFGSACTREFPEKNYRVIPIAM